MDKITFLLRVAAILFAALAIALIWLESYANADIVFIKQGETLFVVVSIMLTRAEMELKS